VCGPIGSRNFGVVVLVAPDGMPSPAMPMTGNRLSPGTEANGTVLDVRISEPVPASQLDAAAFFWKK
jgi:hypothetical protein